MPKCSVGSTDYVCNFLPPKNGVMWKILMFEIYAKNVLRDVILGSEEKTSVLAAHLSRNSGAANTVLFIIQTFNEHSRMTKLSQPYLRGHMRWNITKSRSYVKEWGTKILDTCQLWSRIFSQRGNWWCFDWYCDIFLWPAPDLAISTQTYC